MSEPDLMKTCPDCAEQIRAEARRCRYCNFEYAKADRPLVAAGIHTASAGARDAPDTKTRATATDSEFGADWGIASGPQARPSARPATPPTGPQSTGGQQARRQAGAWMREHKLATAGLLVVALIVIGAAAGGPTNSATSTTADSPSSSTPTPAPVPPASGAAVAVTAAAPSSNVNAANDPSKNATETNVPRVGPSGPVEVDDLRWSLDSSKATSTIGDPSLLGARANGVFIVADLSVTNSKTGSVTISSDAVSLVAGGKTYEGDSAAETALLGAGAKTFLADDLGPGVVLKGAVAFDVARSVLAEHPQLRFNELGFGSTHAYIALPALTAG